LIFICPCIVIINPNYNQQDATFLDLFISTDALHPPETCRASVEINKSRNVASSVILIYRPIRDTVSHNTTIFAMSDGILHWIQLHVSALGMGRHQVVLRLIE
jgi:uncharacterized Fe-S cluster-containing protein